MCVMGLIAVDVINTGAEVAKICSKESRYNSMFAWHAYRPISDHVTVKLVLEPIRNGLLAKSWNADTLFFAIIYHALFTILCLV